jgi:hypothetical protein
MFCNSEFKAKDMGSNVILLKTTQGKSNLGEHNNNIIGNY